MALNENAEGVKTDGRMMMASRSGYTVRSVRKAQTRFLSKMEITIIDPNVREAIDALLANASAAS